MHNYRWQLYNQIGRYGLISKLLHWASAMIFSAMLVWGFMMAGYISGVKYWSWYGMHKQIGIISLCIIVIRLGYNLIATRVRTSHWRLHIALYACLVAMPLSGWVMSSSAGFPPKLFGVKLAIVPSGNAWLTKSAGLTHLIVSCILIVLIVWHVGGLVMDYRLGKRRITRMAL